ncbi:hypothetical protein MMC26_003682 [Xylographa opegraphella]|nr:hypothetical protein [Xylographa opegraphella]
MAPDTGFEDLTKLHGSLDSLTNSAGRHITSQTLQLKTADSERAKRALETLNDILLGGSNFKTTATTLQSFISTIQGVTLVNTPIGSYALRVWDRSEPVLCSIAGTPSESTFFSLARARFRKFRDASIAILKANKKAINMFHLSIDNFIFVLQYRQLPLSLSSEVSKVLSSGNEYGRDSVACKKTMVYRDTLYIKNHVHDPAAFEMSYFRIKSWALSHGIYSSRFKYFGELDLIKLVANACQKTVLPYRPEQVIAHFFEEFTAFQFDKLAVLGDDESNAASKKHPVDHHPSIDFTTSMSSGTFSVVKDVVDRTQRMAVEHPSSQYYLPTFVAQYTSWVLITLSYWGSSSIKGGRFVDMVDMAVAEWINSSNQAHPHPNLCIWPTRVKDSRKEAPDGSYEAFYIVAIGSKTATTSPTLDLRLPDHLSRLLSTIRSSPYYDAATTFADADINPDISVDHLVPDSKDWGLVPDEEKPDDSSDGEAEEEEEAPEEADFWGPPKPKRTSRSKANHTQRSPEDLSSRPGEPVQPLRPALDILSRIRYDPAYDAEDYLIGYLDRHSGMKEMPVTWWKGEDSTEEDFIPQSRIKYYKRKSDGTVLWDRERKLDLMFGSGFPGGLPIL